LNNNSIQFQVSLGASTLKEVSDSAKLDAQILLSFVLNKPINYLYTWPEKELDQTQLSTFNSLLKERLQSKPIAYITGTKEFWSLPLFCNPSTLIPRPDTEILVEQVLHEAEENIEQRAVQCLDLGTGTGAIALAIASEQPNWTVEAVDYSNDAVQLATKNAHNLSITNVKIYQSDWFSRVEQNSQFDMIISNPPYIDENDIHLGQGDVQFEPLSALVAEKSGLADIERIAKEAIGYLKPGGYVFFEHGYNQAEQVRNIFTALSYEKPKTVQDLNHNDRVTFAQR
jgi:release factor glutamine methyltransferase